MGIELQFVKLVPGSDRTAGGVFSGMERGILRRSTRGYRNLRVSQAESKIGGLDVSETWGNETCLLQKKTCMQDVPALLGARGGGDVTTGTLKFEAVVLDREPWNPDAGEANNAKDGLQKRAVPCIASNGFLDSVGRSVT